MTQTRRAAAPDGCAKAIININATHESVTEPSKAVSIVRESSERHKGHWCTGAQKGPLAPQI